MSDKIWRITVVANGQLVHTKFVTSKEDLEEAEREASELRWENLRGYPVQGEVFVREGVVSWHHELKSNFQPDPVPAITEKDWSRHP